MAESNHTGDNKRTRHFVSFVEIFFAVVLGTSIVDPEIRALLFPPALGSLSFWALIAVYLTAITSWAGWHKSTLKYPYTDSRLGELRSVADALIVVVYGSLLFFASRVGASLLWYLLGFLTGFLLYFVSGILRRTEYRTKEASQIGLILEHCIPLIIAATAYVILSKVLSQFPRAALWAFVLFPLLTMAHYRWVRHWHELPWARGPRNRLTIAVDMDGVIVEQVEPVLEKLKKETGISLTKSDITDWEYPFEGTNINLEIVTAERQKEFVLRMPPIENAVEALRSLSEEFNIVIATSREHCTDPWSLQWLDKHGVPYQSFRNTASQGKILADADLIIDDYIGNIEAFIRNGPPDRQAILFAQPWNRDTTSISHLLKSGRARVANSWQTVLALTACGPPKEKENTMAESDSANIEARLERIEHKLDKGRKFTSSSSLYLLGVTAFGAGIGLLVCNQSALGGWLVTLVGLAVAITGLVPLFRHWWSRL